MAGIDGFPGFIGSFNRGGTKDFTIQIQQYGAVVDITGATFFTIKVDEVNTFFMFPF
jgi:hypothetical protein